MLSFMYDMAQVQSNLKSKPKSNIKTRSSGKILLKLRRPRTEKFKKSLAYSGSKKCNDLPIELQIVTNKTSYKSMVTDVINQKSNQNDCTLDLSNSAQPL